MTCNQTITGVSQIEVLVSSSYCWATSKVIKRCLTSHKQRRNGVSWGKSWQSQKVLGLACCVFAAGAHFTQLYFPGSDGAPSITCGATIRRRGSISLYDLSETHSGIHSGQGSTLVSVWNEESREGRRSSFFVGDTRRAGTAFEALLKT